MPLLSIIVPIYNVEKYLRRCIDSILEQTFCNYELILVDDGSPDHCGEIIDEYAKKDSRVVPVHQNNGGVGSARNSGLNIAKGEYLTFVDPDDYISACTYDTMIDKMTINNLDICICGLVREDWPKLGEKVEIFPENLSESIDSLDLMIKICTTYSNNESIFYQALVNKVFSKRTFNGIRFSGYFGEDCDAINKMMTHSYKIGFVNEKLYHYVNNPTSVSHVRNIRTVVRFLEIFKFRWENYDDTRIRNSARNDFCRYYLYLYVQSRKTGFDVEGKYKSLFIESFFYLIKRFDCNKKLFAKGISYLVLPDVYYQMRKFET